MRADTLGLLAEAVQLARDLGYDIQEEQLGDTSGGLCRVGKVRRILLNIAEPPAEQLEQLLEILAADDQWPTIPVSRLLAGRLRQG